MRRSEEANAEYIDKQLRNCDHYYMWTDPHPETGKPQLRVKTPKQIINITNVEELKLQLKHYQRPNLKLRISNSTTARKWYVERLRPALRYWCKVYSVEIPKWLKDESYYINLPTAQKMDLFGTSHLNVFEFQKVKKYDGPSPFPKKAKAAPQPGQPQK